MKTTKLPYKHRSKLFWSISAALLVVGIASILLLTRSSQLNILPMIISTRNHPAPQRTPDTFAESFDSTASWSSHTFIDNKTFSFSYRKSPKQSYAFTGIFFPLENLDFDFSKYDAIQIEIETQQARRIPFNLSVQNKKETHQYVRNFIEIKKGITNYTLHLADFKTPGTWYDRNNLSQVEIPEPDFSKIEALSLESCHLLASGIEDKFTVKQIVLVKEQRWLYLFIIGSIALLILVLRLFLYFPVNQEKEVEVVHIPIEPTNFGNKDSLEDKIIIFLAENYTNPNLTLSNLAEEFGKTNNEISKLVKEKTERTFPKYLSFLRIEEAKRILKSGNYKTVSEVGYTVGFNSPSNFIRVFKGLEDISPKNYSELEQ